MRNLCSKLYWSLKVLLSVVLISVLARIFEWFLLCIYITECKLKAEFALFSTYFGLRFFSRNEASHLVWLSAFFAGASIRVQPVLVMDKSVTMVSVKRAVRWVVAMTYTASYWWLSYYELWLPTIIYTASPSSCCNLCCESWLTEITYTVSHD